MSTSKPADARVTKLCAVCQKPHTNKRYCSDPCKRVALAAAGRRRVGFSGPVSGYRK